MQCEVCGCRMQPGVILYRVNPKGEVPARWRCKPCMDAPPPDDVRELCETIAPSRETEEAGD